MLKNNNDNNNQFHLQTLSFMIKYFSKNKKVYIYIKFYGGEDFGKNARAKI